MSLLNHFTLNDCHLSDVNVLHLTFRNKNIIRKQNETQNTHTIVTSEKDLLMLLLLLSSTDDVLSLEKGTMHVVCIKMKWMRKIEGEEKKTVIYWVSCLRVVRWCFSIYLLLVLSSYLLLSLFSFCSLPYVFCFLPLFCFEWNKRDRICMKKNRSQPHQFDNVILYFTFYSSFSILHALPVYLFTFCQFRLKFPSYVFFWLFLNV